MDVALFSPKLRHLEVGLCNNQQIYLFYCHDVTLREELPVSPAALMFFF